MPVVETTWQAMLSERGGAMMESALNLEQSPVPALFPVVQFERVAIELPV
jgi:hypothetical protein